MAKHRSRSPSDRDQVGKPLLNFSRRAALLFPSVKCLCPFLDSLLMLLIFPSGTLKHQAFLKAVEYYHERATVLLEPRIGMCGKVRNTDKDHDIKEKGRGLRNHLVLYPQEKQDKLPLDRSTIN